MIKNKTALILGINGNLGIEVAKTFESEGYSIIGTYRNLLTPSLPLKNSPYLIKLDMQDPESVNDFLKQIDKLPNLDFVTNTISNKIIFSRFDSIKENDIREDMEINFINYFKILQRLTPKLNEGANIVFILTEAICTKPPKYMTPYVCTKYALLGLMKSLAEELVDRNININAISPGMIETKFIDNFPSFVKDNYRKNSKLGRLLLPEEVAHKIMLIVKENNQNGVNFEYF